MASRREEASMGRAWAKGFLAVIAIALIIVWEHNQAVHLQSQIRPLEKEVTRLTYENAHLQMQLNQWLSNSHLDAVGRKELGLTPVDPAHIIGVQHP